MGRSNRKMTEKEMKYIIDNHDKMSLREIGGTLGYSHEWINQILKAQHIKKKRVTKAKEWVRPCKRCGILITNEKFNIYCPKCRHIIMAKTFYRINMEMRKERAGK